MALAPIIRAVGLVAPRAIAGPGAVGVIGALGGAASIGVGLGVIALGIGGLCVCCAVAKGIRERGGRVRVSKNELEVDVAR